MDPKKRAYRNKWLQTEAGKAYTQRYHQTIKFKKANRAYQAAKAKTPLGRIRSRAKIKRYCSKPEAKAKRKLLRESRRALLVLIATINSHQAKTIPPTGLFKISARSRTR